MRTFNIPCSESIENRKSAVDNRKSGIATSAIILSHLAFYSSPLSIPLLVIEWKSEEPKPFLLLHIILQANATQLLTIFQQKLGDNTRGAHTRVQVFPTSRQHDVTQDSFTPRNLGIARGPVAVYLRSYFGTISLARSLHSNRTL